MTRDVLPALLLLLGACTPSGLDRDAVSAPAQAPTTGTPAVNTEAMLNLTRKSDLVVVATVISLGDPPPAWSGFAAAFQRATYSVDRTLKGAPLTGTVEVRHPIVHGSTSSDPTKPALNAAIFTPGLKVILVLNRVGDGLVCAHESTGAAPWSEALEQALSAGLAG